MNIGYISLFFSFILLAIVVLWFFIQTKGRAAIKAVLMAIVIWYSFAIYFSVPSFFGWPNSREDIPSNSWILSIKIKEPNVDMNERGAIYFWVDLKPVDLESIKTIDQFIRVFDPRKTFLYIHSNGEPRAYRLDYSKELHKKIIEAMKKKEGTPGAEIAINIDGRRIDSNRAKEERDDVEMVIINPIDFLPKD